jgi:hypothetical protein
MERLTATPGNTFKPGEVYAFRGYDFCLCEICGGPTPHEFNEYIDVQGWICQLCDTINLIEPFLNLAD